MSYDNWKQEAPDCDNYIEDKECRFCGVDIRDDKGLYCSDNCYRADGSAPIDAKTNNYERGV